MWKQIYTKSDTVSAVLCRMFCDPILTKHGELGLFIYVQPIPLGVTFSKDQSSKLERLFCHVSVKRDVRTLSFELETAFEHVTPSGIGCNIDQNDPFRYFGLLMPT